MANTTITNLPTATSLTGSEELNVVQSNTSKSATVGQIGAYVNSTYPAPGVSSVATSAPITGGTITSTGTIGLQAAGVSNTYLANMAAGTVKANVTGGSATPSDVTPSALLDTFGSTQGMTLYRGNTSWAALPSSGTNTLLSVSGPNANPAWQTLSYMIDNAINSASVQGSILYRGASSWQALGPGLAGQKLQTNGTGANPVWSSSGAGSVTQIDTGTGLTGGPITLSGTISIANTGVVASAYGSASSVPVITVNAQGQLTSVSNTSIAISASQINSGVLGVSNGGTGLSTTPANGALDIGNGTSFTRSTLTAGSGVSISNGSGSITISATGSGGTVTSINVSGGTTGLTTSGGPVTSSGTITLGGTLGIANGGTGLTAFGTGVQTALGQNVTGSGGIVLANSPSLVTPNLGSATASNITLTTGTISTTPSNATDIANKGYVDDALNSVNYHPAVSWATTADLGSVTYNNGSGGIGATLTNAGTQAALVIDGHTFTSTDATNATRVLVKNESNAAYNGVYTVTNQGSGSTNWVLTRATDYNQSGTGQNKIAPGDYLFVTSGTANANTAWIQSTPLPITVGTTGINFTQVAGTGTYTAGTGLTLSGNQFSISNTAVSANTYGSASSVGTFTVNGQGQLTAASSTPIAIAASQITSGTLGIANGGTGQSTASAAFNALSPVTSTGDLIIGNGTNSATRLAIGSNGYVLTSNGTTATWAASTGGVTSFQTSLSGLTPSTSTTGAVTLAGTLGATSGGTGQSTYATGDILYASASNTLSKLTAGTNGYVLTLAGGVPTWAASTGGVTSFSAGTTGFTPNTGTTGAITLAGTLNVANGGTGQTTASAAFNALSPITSTGDLIIGNGTNSATRLGIGANAYVLTSNGTTASWAAIPSSGGGTYTRTSFTATGGQTSFTVTYTVGYVQVYLNGVLLNAADYTATSGTAIVLAVAASAGDIVEVIALYVSLVSGVSVSGTPTAGQIATWVNSTTIQGTAAVPSTGSNIFLADYFGGF